MPSLPALSEAFALSSLSKCLLNLCPLLLTLGSEALSAGLAAGSALGGLFTALGPGQRALVFDVPRHPRLTGSTMTLVLSYS